MTLWRKFIRWLAKKELALDAALAEFDKTVSISNQKLVSYLQGHHDGARDALKILEEQLQNGPLALEDLQAMKGRKLH
jgi:hypothetical protein